MPSFRLAYWMHPGDAPRELAFDAENPESAHAAGGAMIARALGRPDEFALLDRAAGRFVVGAAAWSRSGFYRLAADEAAPISRRSRPDQAEWRA